MSISDLIAARTQMPLSLGFHIIFAEIGIAMPLLMVLAEWRWRRTGDAIYLQLARRWDQRGRHRLRVPHGSHLSSG